MNNNFDRYKDAKICGDSMKSQQFNFGGPSVPGRYDDRERTMDRERDNNRNNNRDNNRDRGDQPRMTPPGAPGMGEPPRTAPPSFIPEGPRMERRPMAGPGQEQFGVGGRYQQEFQVRPRDLQGCLFHFTFIWLINGNAFWFYPTFVGRQFVEGFRWRRNRWEYDRINIRRIIFFRCY